MSGYMSVREHINSNTPERELPTSNRQKSGVPLSTTTPIEHILHLQRTVGNHAVQKLIKSGALQAKLKIGQLGGKYEQEANRIHGKVMKIPEQRVHVPVVGTRTLSRIQRENPYAGTRVQEIISAPGMSGHIPIPIPYNQLDTGSVNVFHAWKLGRYTRLPPHVVAVSQMPEFNGVRFYHLCVDRIAGLSTGTGPHLYVLLGSNLRFRWSNIYSPRDWLMSRLRSLMSQTASTGP